MCEKKKNKVIDIEVSDGFKPSASLTAVHKSGSGELKGIRHETNSVSKSVNHHGDSFNESIAIRTKTSKNQKGIEGEAVNRFLPHFNKANNSSFVISDEIPEESDIKDMGKVPF